MTTRAVLFDVDGTLVDSNYLHVEAWSRAFAQRGQPVDSWRIQAAIGMDSSLLLKTLLGETAVESGKRVAELHGRFSSEVSQNLRPLSGAREVVREVAQRGRTAVLATSAPENELAILREALQVDGFISTTTSSQDLAVAKPEPDIVHVALERAGVDACDAVLVGLPGPLWLHQITGAVPESPQGRLRGKTQPPYTCPPLAYILHHGTQPIRVHEPRHPLP